MPEGDSIYRAAQALHRALAGKTVTSFETVLPKLARIDDDAPVTGRTIERVTSAGKNLIIEFSGDLHRSEEHTSELQSPDHLVCRLLLEKKNERYSTRC